MSDPDYLELEQDFGEVMGILREGRLEAPTESPDISVWKAIADGLGDEVAVGELEPESTGGYAEVVSLDSRRSIGRRVAVVTAVAAAILLVAVPLTLALQDEDAQRAELAALGGFGGAGAAELSGRTLTVDLDGLTALEGGAAYELWLLDFEGEELKDLHWVGVAEADGSFTIPDDVDLSEFTVVDVSIEPDDGNPEHSGDSVLRGGLQEA